MYNANASYKEKISRKMFITYKTRINTAERLRKNDNLIQFINIYYSLFLTALSIYSIKHGSDTLSIMITISSTILLVSVVFLGSKQYGKRARELKNNYIQIDVLRQSLETIDDNDIEQISKINDNYAELLNNTENHSEFDYYAAISSMDDEKLQKEQIVKYGLYIIYTKIIVIFLIVLPFLLKLVVNLFENLFTF